MLQSDAMKAPETKSMADLPAIPGHVMLDRLVGWFFGLMPLSGIIYEVSQMLKGAFSFEPNGRRFVTYALSFAALMLVAVSKKQPMLVAIALLTANAAFLIWSIAAGQLVRLSGTFLGLEIVAIAYCMFRVRAMSRGER